MRFCLAAGAFFASPFLLAADSATVADAVTAKEAPAAVPVEEGDIIAYPHAAEAVEVTAIYKGLSYACSIGPGDFFEIGSVFFKDSASLRKTAGRKGDQTHCHKGSYIIVQGTKELTKSQEGIPEVVFKMFYPFVYDNPAEETNLLKSRTITGETPESSQGLLITEADIVITHPADAEPFETEAWMNFLSFRCKAMPGDSFSIVDLSAFPHPSSNKLRTKIMLQKISGAEGNQRICPLRAYFYLRTTECLLKRTEEGVPEGAVCPFSPQEIFEKLRPDY